MLINPLRTAYLKMRRCTSVLRFAQVKNESVLTGRARDGRSMILNIFVSESVLMPLTYHSGEEIKPGDLVMFHGEPGEIEFVADPLADNIDPEISWHVQEFGGGVGVIEPKHFGRAFISDPNTDEDLVFVSLGY